VLLAVLALVFVALNAGLPTQIDDTAYFYYARQIASHPLDPYGFQLIWYEQREPAMEVLAPPLVPYWWALGMRLLGDQVSLWKIWLLPFGLMLFFALFCLFRRFAPGLEWEGTFLLTFSPAFLPSFNLMLDLPALALSLMALVVLVRSCDSGSGSLGVLSGILGGLAMQTKYTALLGPPVLLLYAWSVGKLRLGLLCSLVATAIFAAWEGFLFCRYGQSHFWFHVRETGAPLLSKYLLILPLFSILGGAAPAGALVNLCALQAKRIWIIAAACLAALGYALVMIQNFVLPVSLAFGAMGVLVGITSVLVAWRLLRMEKGSGNFSQGDAKGEQHSDGKRPRPQVQAMSKFGNLAPVWKAVLSATRTQQGFLVLWLAMELAGYFVLSPFAAVRRVLGMLVAGSLAAGNLATRTCQAGTARALLSAVIAVNTALGLTFYLVDWRDASAEKQAVEAARESVFPSPGATVWYVGHWGFQFYAERGSMKPVVPYESWLQEGDWLIVPDPRINQQSIAFPEENLESRDTIVVADWLPLGTISCFYGGAMPLKHLEDSRLEVDVYRVRRSFQARPARETDS
jgi:hypothetical protein